MNTNYKNPAFGYFIEIFFVVVLIVTVYLATTQADAAVGTDAQTKPILGRHPGGRLCGLTQAVCYSGFRSGQHPDRGNGASNPSDKEILEDLKILSRQCDFRLIRLYDSQTNSATVLRLIQSENLKIKVLLGAWLSAEINNSNCPWQKQPYTDETLAANKLQNAKEINSAVDLANQYPNIVVAVAVGNEALVKWNDHMVPVDSVISYVRKVKEQVSQPVTVADNYDWWVHHGEQLAKELDFVSIHIYPVWEGKDIDNAMSYTIANYQAVRNALPQSQLVITEAGWATVASEFGARADEKMQKRYYRELFTWAEQMQITTFFFEAFDEDWKGNPSDPLGAEKHWGLFTTDRKPKDVVGEIQLEAKPQRESK